MAGLQVAWDETFAKMPDADAVQGVAAQWTKWMQTYHADIAEKLTTSTALLRPAHRERFCQPPKAATESVPYYPHCLRLAAWWRKRSFCEAKISFPAINKWTSSAQRRNAPQVVFLQRSPPFRKAVDKRCRWQIPGIKKCHQYEGRKYWWPILRENVYLLPASPCIGNANGNNYTAKPDFFLWFLSFLISKSDKI